MTIQEHAAAILAAFESRDPEALVAVAVASCHAEDAYAAVPVDGDAARYALGTTFLRSLAVGQPEHSA